MNLTRRYPPSALLRPYILYLASRDGRTEAEQADAARISRAAYNRILRGQTASPSPEALWGITSALQGSATVAYGLAGWLDVMDLDDGLAQASARSGEERGRGYGFQPAAKRVMPAALVGRASTAAQALREGLREVDDADCQHKLPERSEWTGEAPEDLVAAVNRVLAFARGGNDRPLRRPVDLAVLLSAIDLAGGLRLAWWAGLLDPRLQAMVDDFRDIWDEGKAICATHSEQVRRDGWTAIRALWGTDEGLERKRDAAPGPSIQVRVRQSGHGRLSVSVALSGDLASRTGHLADYMGAAAAHWAAEQSREIGAPIDVSRE